jgi:hypothetical protein
MRHANGNRNRNGRLTVRHLGEADLERVLRLAELDSAIAPPAPLVGVEENGSLLAAASITTGEMIADPFKRTAGPREMLRVVLETPGTNGRPEPR